MPETRHARSGDMFEANGRRIVNCTVGGNLELFERLDLESALRG